MKNLFGLLSRTAAKNANACALMSPNQVGRLGEQFTYQELKSISAGLAIHLKGAFSTEKGAVIVSDLPNISENLILQLACANLNVSFATVKDTAGLNSLRDSHNVVGIVPGMKDSWLTEEFGSSNTLLGGDFESAAKEWLERGAVIEDSNSELASYNVNTDTEDLPHAYFNSTKALSGGEIVELGEATAHEMGLTTADKVLVSITLCHSFGIASGVGGAFSSGAALVLPAVGGIRGCGVPSERAEATLSTLKSTGATILLADTHIVKNFPQSMGPLTLTGFRGGIVKTGSGSTFLADTVDFAGVSLRTMGKKA